MMSIAIQGNRSIAGPMISNNFELVDDVIMYGMVLEGEQHRSDHISDRFCIGTIISKRTRPCSTGW